MPFWRDRLAGTAAEFEADLLARGFERADDGWLSGTIPVPSPGGGTVAKPYRIRLPGTFPFGPPVVALPTTPAALTWHLSPCGVLCLFRTSDNPDRPWDTVDGLFARVADWVQQNSRGWPDDPGDPDLERYFEKHLDFLVSFDSDEHATGPLRSTEINSTDWIHLSANGANRKARRRDRTLWLYGVDVGVLDSPIWNWSTLGKALPVDHAAEVEKLALAETGVLLVHYQRDGTEGPRRAAVALFVQPPKPTKVKHSGRVTTPPTLASNAEPTIAALEIADDSLAARSYRGGPQGGEMSTKHVALVGCGAVGSFVADLLVRSGIGELTLVDGERLLPGNCIRHLADRRHVPKLKVEAVRDVIVERELLTADKVHTIKEHLTAEIAATLLTDTDIVIDATANAAVTGLLRDLALHIGRVNFLKISLHREGELVRVDRFGDGTRDDAGRPPFIESLPGTDPTYREAGCGDPVSATQPSAVLQAASMACRYALDALRPTNRQSLPDSCVEVLVSQPDEPWTQPGIIG